MTAAAHPPETETDENPAVSLNFADRLHEAIGRFGTPACVGLDPVVEKLPAAARSGRLARAGAAEQIEAFCMGILDAVAETVPIVKPQSACFERYGQSGLGVLRKVINAAHARGLLVILDAKRGDIGTTAEHYAAAAFGPQGASAERPGFAADGITLSGYMGMDTIEPFLAHDLTAGVFVLVRTSNPGSDAIQAQRLEDGRTVAEMVADQVAELGRRPGNTGACGLSRVGAVVGATKSAEAAALRARMSDQFLLIPGYGAQGGTLADLKPMLRTTTNAADAGIVVNASRSVIYASASTTEDWIGSVREAARRFADDLRTMF